MKPIAILQLLNDFGDASITRIVEKIVGHSGSQNINWHVGALSQTGDMQPCFKKLNCTVAAPACDTKGTLNIRQYLINNEIDIVHTHTPRTILQASLALRASLPTVHLATKHILNATGDRRWGSLYTLFDRFSLFLPDAIVAVSNTLYKQIVATPGLRSEHVSVVQNAVDCEHFYAQDQREDCRSELGLGPANFLIGSAGRLDKVKRFDVLLRAFSVIVRQCPDVRLMIIGDGSLKEELLALAGQLGIEDRVIMPGFRKDIPRLLAAMDVYVQTSVNEGLSLSILEAMAAEKPVVITDVGAAREIVTPRKTGMLMKPNSTDAVIDALLELIAKPDIRCEIARSAREQVNREFNYRRMTEAYGSIYRKLIQDMRSGAAF